MNTLISVTDTKSSSIVRTIVPGLHPQTTTVILFVHTTCTRIVDTAMRTKSTWEARADALVTDITATVITLHVHFTNTSMLVTYTASTWVVQIRAITLALNRPADTATTIIVPVTFTVAYAMKTKTTSTPLDNAME